MILCSSWRYKCGESKKSLTLFKIARAGFTCGWLATIHSRRVRTALFPVTVPLGVSLRRLPLSSKNSCSSTSATPMPSSPPATQIFRPRLRCELAKETERGRTSFTNICRPRLPGGRCIRSTRGTSSLFLSAAAPGPASPSWECAAVGGDLSVSADAASDVYTTTNAASSSLSGSHAPGRLAGRSLGRSTRAQSSTRPPTFCTGVGGVLHAA